MKKIILSLTLLFSYLFSSGQSLSVSPASVETGSIITITGVEETLTRYFQNIQFDYFGSSTTSPSNYMSSINVSNGAQTQNFSPGVPTTTPTKYTFKIINMSSVPITLTLAFNCTVSGLGGNIVKTVTLTVTPTPPQSTFYNTAKSGIFVKNNCAAGTAGSSVTYTIPANTPSCTSTVSQADADAKAQNLVNSGGQAYANANGQCLTLYYNSMISGAFTKNNCDPGYSGTSVVYSVPAQKHQSTISQVDADQLAVNDLNSNGPNYANAHGDCIEIRTAYISNYRSTICTNGTNTQIWLKDINDLNSISQFNSVTGIYAYSSQSGSSKVIAGYYYLDSIPNENGQKKVFRISAQGEITRYYLCP